MEQNVNRRRFLGRRDRDRGGRGDGAVGAGKRPARQEGASARRGCRQEGAGQPARHPAVHDAAHHGQVPGRREQRAALARAAGLHRGRDRRPLRLDARRSSGASSTARGCAPCRGTTGRTTTSPPAGRTATRRRWPTRRRSARSSPASRGRTCRRRWTATRSWPPGSTRRARSPEAMACSSSTTTTTSSSCNKQADGSPLYDILLEETDRRLVKFELDLFWITEGGANGVAVPERRSDAATSATTSRTTSGATGRRQRRGGLRGRRSRHARLPGPLRGGRRGRQALLHRARHAAALAPGRRREAEYLTAAKRDQVSRTGALLRNSSCSLVSPAISGWNEITSTFPWRTATG